MTAKRWEILRALTGAEPLSIREIARRVERDVKAVHADLHGKYPDLPDDIARSAEVDLIAKANVDRTEGVKGLCLDPHDLAIAKYVAGGEKDFVFTRELARRRIVTRKRLLALVDETPVGEDVRQRVRDSIGRDFKRKR